MYASSPELDKYNQGLVLEYGIYLIGSHLNSNNIDRADEVVRVLNDCLRNGGSVVEERKKYIADLAFSTNGFEKLKEKDKLMSNILNLGVVAKKS